MREPFERLRALIAAPGRGPRAGRSSRRPPPRQRHAGPGQRDRPRRHAAARHAAAPGRADARRRPSLPFERLGHYRIIEPDRPRRDGRRLPRLRRVARARGGHQGAAAGAGPRRGLRPPLPRRGHGGRQGGPSQRGARLLHRRGRRPPLLRHAVRRGRVAGRSGCAAAAAAGRTRPWRSSSSAWPAWRRPTPRD